MHSQKSRSILVIFAGIAAMLSACGGSGSSSGPVFVPPPPPPPPPAQTAFSQFVQDQFAATADDTEPEPVDDVDFAFDEDPTAFDSLLQ